MIKTIVATAVAIVVAAAPALAGPGVVLQGRAFNGVNLSGVTAPAHTPQRVDAETGVAAVIAASGETRSAVLARATAPVALAGGDGGNACPAWRRGFNGVSLNGIQWNGMKSNGLKVNGIVLNGMVLNGLVLNGLVLNGVDRNGWSLNGLSTNGLASNGLTWNGITFNGLTLNGLVFNDIKWNGAELNGKFLNGRTFNGKYLNGKLLNGKMFNGAETGAVASEPVEATFAVTAVTLPSGERVAIGN